MRGYQFGPVWAREITLVRKDYSLHEIFMGISGLSDTYSEVFTNATGTIFTWIPREIVTQALEVGWPDTNNSGSAIEALEVGWPY